MPQVPAVAGKTCCTLVWSEGPRGGLQLEEIAFIAKRLHNAIRPWSRSDAMTAIRSLADVL